MHIYLTLENVLVKSISNIGVCFIGSVPVTVSCTYMFQAKLKYKIFIKEIQFLYKELRKQILTLSETLELKTVKIL